MSGRARPRKDRDETPAASVAKSPAATRQRSAPNKDEQVEEKKTAGSKPTSKLQESQEVRVSKPRCSTRKDTSTEEEKPSRNVSEKVKKNPRSEAVKSPDAKVSGAASKVTQESKDVRARKSVKDVNTTEETAATKPARSKERKAAAPLCPVTRGCSTEENPKKVLQNALEKLKVKKSQRSESSKCVNDIQTKITEYVKRHLDWCKDISILKTGSYYENVKICEPDEFDVMMTVRVERVTLLPFSKDGAFYSVEMKRHPQKHPLDKFVNEDKTLMASEMLKEFREKVKDAMATLKYDVTLERKKMGCPAVTMTVKENGKPISIDFVLGLEVHSSWPDFTQNGFNIENWLSKKVKMEQRRQPFYLVPKYEGRGTMEQDGIMAKDAWRISFSHVEKHILKNHGNSKTCCEKGQKCCRKQCLKLLKYLLQRLKQEHPEEADKLCSYHAKTALLRACAVRGNDSKWAESELSHCFQQLLQDFELYLRNRELPNFFIPSQNLFNNLGKKNSNSLADYIEDQRNNGFPLLC